MKLNKRKMFLLISALVVLNTLTYSAPEDDAENTLNQIDKSIEQEKQRIEQEKRQKELENTKFNSTVPEEIAPVQDNGIKFLINNINIEDKDKLLSSGEKKKLIKKYKGTELSANDITALLTQGTNKLIAKIARQLGIDKSGYRVITNINSDGGQEVYHLHYHLLGGEKLRGF